MVENTQAEDLGSFGELVVYAEVVVAGAKVAAWVVVCEDDGGGAVGDHVSEDFAGVNLAPIEEADGDDAFFDDFICAVERDADEVLLLLPGNVDEQRKRVGGSQYPHRFLRQMPPGEFKSCENLPRLRRPHAVDGSEVRLRNFCLLPLNDPGYVFRHCPDIMAMDSPAEDDLDKFFVRQGSGAFCCHFLPGTVVFGHFLDRFQEADHLHYRAEIAR